MSSNGKPNDLEILSVGAPSPVKSIINLVVADEAIPVEVSEIPPIEETDLIVVDESTIPDTNKNPGLDLEEYEADEGEVHEDTEEVIYEGMIESAVRKSKERKELKEKSKVDLMVQDALGYLYDNRNHGEILTETAVHLGIQIAKYKGKCDFEENKDIQKVMLENLIKYNGVHQRLITCAKDLKMLEDNVDISDGKELPTEPRNTIQS